MKTLEFRIRKLHVNNETEKRVAKRQATRVYVNEEALLELTGSKDGGSAVKIERISDGQAREATLWRAPEKLDKGVTQLYEAFRDTCGYKLGETVRITALGGTIPDAETVEVEDVSPKEAALEPLAEAEVVCWEHFLALYLHRQIEHVYPGLVIKNVTSGEPERAFRVLSVNGRDFSNARFKHKATLVKITEESAHETKNVVRKLELAGVRGLDEQVAKINSFLSLFHGKHTWQLPPVPRALIVHGSSGTGKTMILNRIADSGWGTVHRINFKDKLVEIPGAAAEYRAHRRARQVGRQGTEQPQRSHVCRVRGL
jgi:AAA family ATPase